MYYGLTVRCAGLDGRVNFLISVVAYLADIRRTISVTCHSKNSFRPVGKAERQCHKPASPCRHLILRNRLLWLTPSPFRRLRQRCASAYAAPRRKRSASLRTAMRVPQSGNFARRIQSSRGIRRVFRLVRPIFPKRTPSYQP